MAKRKKKNGPSNPADSLNPLLHLDVTRALLHISFCNEHVNSQLLEDLRSQYQRGQKPFKVLVHRMVGKEHGPEKFSNVEDTINVPDHLLKVLFGKESTETEASAEPQRCKRRIEIDVSRVVKDWYRYPKRNHGLFLTTEPARLKNFISFRQMAHVRFLDISLNHKLIFFLYFLILRNRSWSWSRRRRRRSG